MQASKASKKSNPIMEIAITRFHQILDTKMNYSSHGNEYFD